MLSTMLPASFHQQSPVFAHYSPQNVVNHEEHMMPHYNPTQSLDTLAETSHDALQQFHHDHRHFSVSHLTIDSRHHPYQRSISSPHFQRAPSMTQVRMSRPGSQSGPVRRRISRACDQCNQLRTKCDGKSPCAHCVEFSLTCEYNRERKKRGKASRKEIAAQQAAAAAAAANGANSGNDEKDSRAGDSDTSPTMRHAIHTGRDTWGTVHRTGNQATPVSVTSATSSNSRYNERPVGGNGLYDPVTPGDDPRSAANTSMTGPFSQHLDQMQGRSYGQHPPLSNGDAGRTQVPNYGQVGEYQSSMTHIPSDGPQMFPTSPNAMFQQFQQGGPVSSIGSEGYPMLSPQSPSIPTPWGFRIPPGESPYGYAPSPIAGSPGWLSMPTPSAAMYSQTVGGSLASQLRYPVLQPLLPYLGNIVPIPVACDLLELYFQSASAVFTQPLSPFILGYVFRKCSFLRTQNPRPSSPALLATMLWVAAQTTDSAFFTSLPSTRGRICQKLLELAVGLLKPLIHTPAPGSEMRSPTSAPNTVVNGVALGGLGITLATAQDSDGESPGVSAALDDVASYIHLATVVSATEYKAASQRWWNAAWSLCRELKLGREMQPSSAVCGDPTAEENKNTEEYGDDPPSNTLSEEQREERRRIWWLCYTIDRHLALCYNKPLFLLDQECEGLLQPMDDAVWQAGEFFNPDVAQLSEDAASPHLRKRGPPIECTGHSIFGYFMPLMTILGEIVNLQQARNHPRFGPRFRSTIDAEDQVAQITSQLEAYGRSLDDLAACCAHIKAEQDPDALPSEAVATPSGHSVASGTNETQESILQTRIVVAYGTQLMHTLHILLNGKWDPISLLDDKDHWISSQSFVKATAHVVSAAEALGEILELDPDLSFMSFFFGIYLLQSSFLLLLIADKQRDEASENVVKACETVVRAHEASVVALNIECQRDFHHVMRSALDQMRGQMAEETSEQKARRREVLRLYRWTGDGTGLAL